MEYFWLSNKSESLSYTSIREDVGDDVEGSVVDFVLIPLFFALTFFF